MDLSASEYLDRLAKAFRDAGWPSVPRFERVPPVLRVLDPKSPRYGDTISVTGEGPDGGAWFVSASGAPLAPVGDLERAVEAAGVVIEALRPDVERLGMLCTHIPPVSGGRGGGEVRLIETGDAFTALDEQGRTLGAFYPQDDDPSWWTVCFPNGTDRQIWQPNGDPREVARRAFGT